MSKIIAEVIIPQYIRTVELSKNQRPRYFEFDPKLGFTKLPIKYLKTSEDRPTWIDRAEYLKDQYGIGAFRKNVFFHWCEDSSSARVSNLMSAASLKFMLCHKETKQPVLANPKTAGTPKLQRINAQDFYAGFNAPHIRGKIMQTIKMSFLPYVKDLPVIETYPVRIRLEIVDTVKNSFDRAKEGLGTRFDVDNRAYPYNKAFLDLLATGKTGELGIDEQPIVYFEPKLRDDDRLHVTEAGGALFTPLPDGNDENRRLRFIIMIDDRPSIITHPDYKVYHENSRISNTVQEGEPGNRGMEYPGGSSAERSNHDNNDLW